MWACVCVGAFERGAKQQARLFAGVHHDEAAAPPLLHERAPTAVLHDARVDARVAAPNTYGLRERMVESEQGPLLESEMHGPLLAQVDVAHGNRLVCTHARTHVKVRTCPVECTHIHAAAVE